MESEYFYIDTTCGIALRDGTEVDIWYLIAALNSRVGEYLYRKTTVPKANGFLIYKTMYLSSFPIPIPRNSREQELARRISELAMGIQQCNDDIGILDNAFEKHLTSYLPIMSSDVNFFRDYYSVPEYWKSRELIPPAGLDLRDTVAAIRIGSEIQNMPNATGVLVVSYRSERTGAWKPLIKLQPVDEDLRLFLLLTLRRFIQQNARKKSWKLAGAKNDRTIDVVLNSLVAPVWCFPYGSKGFETNMIKVHELIRVFRKNGKGESDPSVIEATRNTMDEEIDRAFFELYELTEKEKDLVRGAIAR